jgi:hypothetical protein
MERRKETWMTAAQQAGDHDINPDVDTYAREVGEKVAALVGAAIASSPRVHVVATDDMADAITDLIVDFHPDPERSEVADRLAPLWSAERTRRALGISRSALGDRRKSGSVLALRTSDGAFFYPVSQFERRGGKIQVKPGLRSFLMRLRDHDPWTVALILHAQAPELGGSTPLAWIRQSRDQATLEDYADTLHAEWSR